MSVDLPEPDGPMTAVSWPAAIVERDAAQGVDGGVARAVAARRRARGDDRSRDGARCVGLGGCWGHPSGLPSGIDGSRIALWIAPCNGSTGVWGFAGAGARGGATCRRYASTASTRRWSALVGGKPSLTKMPATCFCTARAVTTRRSAIARFERPSAMSASTSRSRGVSALERVVVALGGRAAARRASGRAPSRPSATRRSGVDELGEVDHAVLEQVADAPAGSREQRHRVARLDVLREDEHADVRVRARGSQRRARCPRRCGSAACGCRRPRRRAACGDLVQQLVGVAACADDLEARLGEQARDALAEQPQSSAITTRTGSPPAAASRRRRAEEPRRAVERLDAVGSPRRPGAPPRRRPRRRRRRPRHHGAVRRADAITDARGLRVLGHVGERLGDEEVGGGLRAREPAVEVDGERHRHRRARASDSSAAPRPALGEDRRVDAAGELAQLVERRAQLAVAPRRERRASGSSASRASRRRSRQRRARPAAAAPRRGGRARAAGAPRHRPRRCAPASPQLGEPRAQLGLQALVLERESRGRAGRVEQRRRSSSAGRGRAPRRGAPSRRAPSPRGPRRRRELERPPVRVDVRALGQPEGELERGSPSARASASRMRGLAVAAQLDHEVGDRPRGTSRARRMSTSTPIGTPTRAASTRFCSVWFGGPSGELGHDQVAGRDDQRRAAEHDRRQAPAQRPASSHPAPREYRGEHERPATRAGRAGAQSIALARSGFGRDEQHVAGRAGVPEQQPDRLEHDGGEREWCDQREVGARQCDGPRGTSRGTARARRPRRRTG